MEFCDRLYVSKSIDNADEIKAMLLKHIHILGIYLICISDDTKNIAEIFENHFLLKSKKEYRIIGIANGKSDAEKLFAQIIDDYINSGRSLSVFKKYFG